MILFLRLLALASGLTLAFQPAVNARLRSTIGDPFWAATISFLTGTVALIVVALILRAPFPDFSNALRAPWYVWTGGLLGAIYVTSTIVCIPRLGAAQMLSGRARHDDRRAPYRSIRMVRPGHQTTERLSRSGSNIARRWRRVHDTRVGSSGANRNRPTFPSRNRRTARADPKIPKMDPFRTVGYLSSRANVSCSMQRSWRKLPPVEMSRSSEINRSPMGDSSAKRSVSASEK